MAMKRASIERFSATAAVGTEELAPAGPAVGRLFEAPQQLQVGAAASRAAAAHPRAPFQIGAWHRSPDGPDG